MLDRGRVTAHIQAALFVGAISFGVAILRPSPLPHDANALAEALSATTSVEVRADDLRWEPSSNVLREALFGRSLLFLGWDPTTGTRDVYRARVRLGATGRPLEVLEAYNLSNSPLGDEQSLVIHGTIAAYATLSEGKIQSVSVLDLRGEGPLHVPPTVLDAVTGALTNLQKTGSFAGVGRYEVVFEVPVDGVGLSVGPGGVSIDRARDGKRDRVSFSLERAELPLGADNARLEPIVHPPKRLSHWAVDTVRAVPWIGPRPIAWLEEEVFSARDTARRTFFRVKGGSGGAQPASVDAEVKAPALDTSEASVEAAHWPPQKLSTIWKTPEAGEGEWTIPAVPFLRKVKGALPDAPSAFYRTFVRPDEQRPYAKVLLVAMDSRQLDLEMEAGTEDPQPLTGARGSGKIPRDPEVFTRVAAAFNGCFKTEHGRYGMMVKKRLLLPPQPGAATVITTRTGNVGLGSWGSNKTVSGLKDIADDDIVSFRQNLDALVDKGQVNPTGRGQWGYSAPGKGIQTERSGLCATSSGHLIYAWGDDVSADTLAKAMKMAGCDYGMHLDMNPYHTGFMFTFIEEFKDKRYKVELLSNGMEIPKGRYVEWAPKDFFYVMVRDLSPKPVDGASPWEPDGGTQPPPTWWPGVQRSRVEGNNIELLQVGAGRARYRLRAGTKEGEAAPLSVLPDDDARKVLFAIGLGVSPDHSRGLSVDGKGSFPAKPTQGNGLLVAHKDGRLTIDNSPPADALDVVSLPLLLEEGRPRELPGAPAPVARAALGLTQDGRVIVARASTATAAPLADALKRAGCVSAVLLDRGLRAEGALHRAGSSEAPLARYGESVLYAIAKPMAPRAFRFESTMPAAPPTGKR